MNNVHKIKKEILEIYAKKTISMFVLYNYNLDITGEV